MSADVAGVPMGLDTSGQVPSGGPEPVRGLGDLAARVLSERARLQAAVLGVIAAVGAVLVILGVTTQEQADSALAVTGGVLTSVSTLAAVVVPLLQAQRGAATVRGQAEVVRGEVVPVSEVAAYSPASSDSDVALGPAAAVLDAVDPEQP